MLPSTNHQGKAKQNHSEIPPPTCLNGYDQEERKQVLVRMWIYRYTECLNYYHDIPHNITFILQLKKWGNGSYLSNSLPCHVPNHPEATKLLISGMELKWLTTPCRLGMCPIQWDIFLELLTNLSFSHIQNIKILELKGWKENVFFSLLSLIVYL